MSHSTIPFKDPSQMIAFLDSYGNRADAIEKFNPIKLSIEDRQAYHIFNVCWCDETFSKDKAEHTRKLKNTLTKAQRRRINAARKKLNEIISYNAETQSVFLYQTHERQTKEQALRQLRATERAIKNYRSVRQKITSAIGYCFGFIFAFTNGTNNARAMAGTMLAVALMLGLSGLTFASPYILLPAAIVGIGSFVINGALAFNTSGENFSMLFGEGVPFRALFQYKDKKGNNLRFSYKQGFAFLFAGALPALFSAFCKGVLAGFVVLLILGATPFAAIAMPFAIATMIAFTSALATVYLRDIAKLFHFNESISGTAAIKEYLAKFIFPKKEMKIKIHATLNRFESLLKKYHDTGLNETFQEEINHYKQRLHFWSTALAAVFIPLSVLGIILTLYASAVAAPVLFPFLSLGAAGIIAVLALPGQVPFYNMSAAKCAAKVALAFVRIPSDLKVALAQAERNEIKSKLYKTTDLNSRKNFEAQLHAAERKSLYSKIKSQLLSCWQWVFGISRAGNPLGNGAIAMVSIDFFHPLLNLILKPVTFILSTFSSATLGYALDKPPEIEDPSLDNRFKALFFEPSEGAELIETADDSTEYTMSFRRSARSAPELHKLQSSGPDIFFEETRPLTPDITPKQRAIRVDG